MIYIVALYIFGSLVMGYIEYQEERQFAESSKRTAILSGCVVALLWPFMRAYQAYMDRE